VREDGLSHGDSRAATAGINGRISRLFAMALDGLGQPSHCCVLSPLAGR
jgi:hypothetical protein